MVWLISLGQISRSGEVVLDWLILPHFQLFLGFLASPHKIQYYEFITYHTLNLKTVFFHSHIGWGNMTKFCKIWFFVRGARVSQKSKKRVFFRNTLTLEAYCEKFYYTNPLFAPHIMIQYGLPFLKRCVTSLRTDSNMSYGQK